MKKIRFLDIIYWLAIIGFDLIVFAIIGIALMDYDDNYDSSKGEYWSLKSMNTFQKIIYLFYNTWIILNVIGVLLVIRRIYKRIRSSSK